MNIDLAKIPRDGKYFDEDLVFSEDLIKTTPIQKINKAHFNGKISFNVSDEVILEGVIEGEMVLLDAVDLSEINYPFRVEIFENLSENDEYNLEKEQNVLDIMSILWQNIVLEVPMRVVKKENENVTLQGDGWELTSEDVKKVDPRLAPLMDLLKEGKE